MRVQRVVMPPGVESATVLDDGIVVEPAERFLAHLSAVAEYGPRLRARSAGLLRVPGMP
ncbi:hypothetical protein ABIA39_007909 [Nocardia sp. GAS34]|uniref:hypothetical protein n=1 Tax=unclassified Nocardia TaxID=2637762 RepID=UPI003D192F2C